MRENEPRSNPAAWAAKALAVLTLCLLSPSAARAQWTTPDASGNINNTNPGNVKIGGGASAPTAVVHVRGNLTSPLTGTVAVTQNSAAVTGTGTNFSTELSVGDSVKIGSEVFTVSAVVSASSLTLDSNYLGTTSSGLTAYRDPNLFAVDSGDGVSQLVVTKSGKVGIGSAAPGNTMLDIVNTSSGVYSPSAGPTDSVRIRTLTNSLTSNNFSSLKFQVTANNGIHNALGYLTLVQPSFSSHNSEFAFTLRRGDGSYAEAMRIQSGGNVGIGTASPIRGLHVSGANGTVGAEFVLENTGMPVNNRKFNLLGDSTQGTGGRFYLRLLNDAGSAVTKEFLAFDNATGNVGVGATSPTYKLDVAGQVRSSSGGFVFPDGTVQASAATGTVSGVTAGVGLTGGGASGSLTLNVGAGTGLTAAADSISVNYGSAAGTAVEGNKTLTVTAETGLTGGGQVTLGVGGALTLTNDDKGSAQSIFKNVANASGATQFSAGSNNDALSFEGTGGTTVTFNAAARRVTINSSASAASGWTDGGASLTTTNASASVGIGTAAPTHSLEVVKSASGNFDGLFLYNSAGAPYYNSDSVSFSLGRSSTHVMGQITASNKQTGTFGDGYLAFSTRRAEAVSERMRIDEEGRVGIGTATPTHTLEVNGTINASQAITGATINATYQDVAEWVPSVQKLAPGTVVVLDSARTNHVVASALAYDTKVAGVVSEMPGVILGVGGEGKLKVATTGRVKVKVDATRGAIKVGDLLVTGETEGVAMKSVPVDLGGTPIHRPGTIIGKALEPLEKGTGEILVLLSLQ